MEELKPCPFCGGLADIGTSSVFCTDCGVQMWAQPLSNLDTAVELWNKRSDAE